MIYSSSSDKSEDFLGIADVAAQLKVTARALRHYEKIGLIAPYKRGTTRLYDAAMVDRVEKIVRFARYGFTLSEISDVLKLHRAPLRRRLKQRLTDLEKEARGLNGTIEELKREIE